MLWRTFSRYQTAVHLQLFLLLHSHSHVKHLFHIYYNNIHSLGEMAWGWGVLWWSKQVVSDNFSQLCLPNRPLTRFVSVMLEAREAERGNYSYYFHPQLLKMSPNNCITSLSICWQITTKLSGYVCPHLYYLFPCAFSFTPPIYLLSLFISHRPIECQTVRISKATNGIYLACLAEANLLPSVLVRLLSAYLNRT